MTAAIRVRLEHLVFIGLVALALLFVLAEDQVFDQAAGSAAVASPVAGVVIRDVLAETLPAAAPGETLQLVHYTIPPDLTLPPHTHPGVQVSQIVSGTLTYYVVAGGEVIVNRADGTHVTLGPGESLALAAGDAFVEPPGVVHYAANDTFRPVEITSAVLITAGAPPSTLVDPAATPVATPVASRPRAGSTLAA